eukprot:g24438.t1
MAQAEEIRTETGPLDYDYTEKEVELCQENLQNHKACSPDKIKNEMLKTVSEYTSNPTHVTKLLVVAAKGERQGWIRPYSTVSPQVLCAIWWMAFGEALKDALSYMCMRYLDRTCHSLCTSRPDLIATYIQVSKVGVHLSSPQACLFTSTMWRRTARGAVRHAVVRVVSQ